MVLLEVGGTKNPNRAGDVLFIHGLNGDPIGSWSYNDTEEGFWPKWLAKDCPMLGVWSIGYNAAASAWEENALPHFDQATNILAEIATTDVKTKPICIIAHSMGGLLVKYMLRFADMYASEFGWFSHAVRGILFLSTPHTGSDTAKLAKYLKFVLRTNISVIELEPATPALRELNQWYKQKSVRLNIKTQVYFETQKTQGMRIVDNVSADPGITDVPPLPISANHITIAKPSSKKSLIYSGSKQFVSEVLLTSARVSTAPIMTSPHFRPFLVPISPLLKVIGREKELDDVSHLLALSEKDAADVPPVALRGMGGIGKTTLALELGRREREPVHSIFKDGVLWVELGPKPPIRTLLQEWGKAVGIDLLSEHDEHACRTRLREGVSQRQMLFIVDDVWEKEHGDFFLIAGCGSRTLFTTRESPIAHHLATRARTRRVDVLGPEYALKLLSEFAQEAVDADRKAAQQLCEKLEYLPLAVKLAGKLLADEADVPHRMQRLVDELTERRATRLSLEQVEPRKGLDEDHPVSLKAILGLSVQRLDDLDQVRFARLSNFGGEPKMWRTKAAAFVWECSLEDAEATVSRLIQRGLVEPRSEERYWMHALLADYAADLLEELEG